jgi:2-polyprenyl-6-hydroxyphenyl methylase/3-demethylubiquinone-9 3-methyltransferase
MVQAPPPPPPESHQGSVDPEEIARFEAMAAEWWDPAGKFKPLHKFNPVRIAYIRDAVCAHFGRDPEDVAPFKGLTLLDIGCGGGLIAEPMTRLGAAVTAIDAADKNIGTAKAHAMQMGLDIDYRFTTAEALRDAGAQYDVVLNLEVVEHVADVEGFLGASIGLLKPGGITIVATLNRTLKALALAKIGAEYVLRWLPAGTHDWRKFLKPSELTGALRHAGARVTDSVGMSYNPLTDRWTQSRDTDVNYMLTAVRDSA